MAAFFPVQSNDLVRIKRLCKHHDHLKGLCQDYAYMRKQETYDRMADLTFRCDSQKMHELDESFFTSLLIKLPCERCRCLFDEVARAYDQVQNLVERYHSEAKGGSYFDSAHITVKSILDFRKQDESDLEKYMPVICGVVKKWINALAHDTVLYGMGLFTNLHKDKGLSLGIRFFPSQPLVQILRGDVGDALYSAVDRKCIARDMVRSEDQFHTRLTHSTGYRARDFAFPLHPEFICAFIRVVESFNDIVFGTISGVTLDDVFLRNGKSDRLTVIENGAKVGEELCLSHYCA